MPVGCLGGRAWAFRAVGDSVRLIWMSEPSSRFHETTAVLFSGGIDSTVLLGCLLQRGNRVQPIYIRTGLFWEAVERTAAERVLDHLRRQYGRRLARLRTLDMPVGDLYGEHWSATGHGVPDESSADDAVYLPGRNPLLLLKACLWCTSASIRQLALGTLCHNPFRDATEEFFTAFEDMLVQATGTRIEILRPFRNMAKSQILTLIEGLPLEQTFSCLAPVDGRHCGRCNKCGERRRALEDRGTVEL